ncbi:MAG TPA: RhuM family protein [Steroidobacteraceae bacterium]|nr:RhuM family protein [Steroidobacteraceae bacterium]
MLDDERLKNPDQPFDYFDELLRRIQDIRTSERRFCQKITDIFATSVDYDPTHLESIEFFQTVQKATSIRRSSNCQPCGSRKSALRSECHSAPTRSG